MRIIICGTGAIGGSIGGHLVEVGQEVVFIEVSPSHIKAIREHGLKLVTPIKTNVVRVSLVISPDQIKFSPDDVVFICVKSQYTEEILRDLKTVTKNVPIFCFQNGVQNEEIVATYFSEVYSVSIHGNTVYMNPGEIMNLHEPPGHLIMGRYPTGTDDLVEAVAKSLRTAGYLVLVTPDVMPYKWGKLLANLGNAVNAITNARGNDAARITKAAQYEAEELLTQAGIRWIFWTPEEQMAKLWPESTNRQYAQMATEGQSSSNQSLARQEGSIESDFLNGEIVRVAKRLGRQAPINEALVRISQDMAVNRDLPGKYSVTELIRMVGIEQ